MTTADGKDEPPRTIAVPPTCGLLIDQLTEQAAERMGKPPEEVRRLVEIAVISRGIAELQREPI
jgi:hypothetical protein